MRVPPRGRRQAPPDRTEEKIELLDYGIRGVTKYPCLAKPRLALPSPAAQRFIYSLPRRYFKFPEYTPECPNANSYAALFKQIVNLLLLDLLVRENGDSER